jgi:four helix bundle protein
MQPHERLHAWQKAHALFLAVHAATKSWPREERFELTSQVRRAAFSVPANIVEGASRSSPRAFRPFLDQARGSLAEIGYGLLVAKELGYLTPDAFTMLDAQRDEAARVLWALLAAVTRRAQQRTGNGEQGTEDKENEHQ